MAVDLPPVSAQAVADGLGRGDHLGTWTLLTSPPDVSGSQSSMTCGRCTRCLDGCPTDAFVGPFHLDPQRCISYWTIESRQPIPRALRPLFGNRIFGCDICQEVCPWNARLPERTPLLASLSAQGDRIAPSLLEGFSPQSPYWLEPSAFSERFRGSPIKRAKRAGMLRNVCVALGNWADPSALASLALALNDEEALGRGHAAWAIGQIARRHRLELASDLLQTRLGVEDEAWVAEEIRAALLLAGLQLFAT